MIATASEIEYFVEVYKTSHVSRAAIRLGVTQPTLTLSLQKLEEKLGSKLFHRTKQGVVPTPQGTLFYRKANELMECWHTLHQDLSNTTSEIQGRFKIGCHQSVGAYTLPLFLDRLHKEAPLIELELVHDFSRKITEKVVSFQIDLGFVVNPVRHPDLVLKKIGDDRVMFWKKAGTKNLPKIIFADSNLNQIQDILGKTHFKSFKDWKLIHTPSLELIRTLTLSGQGVGILPERVGILPERVAMADGANLVPYDSNLPVFEDKIFVTYRKDVLSSKAGRELARIASVEI